MVPSISDIIRETTGIKITGQANMPVKPITPHPLDNLSAAEITLACNIVKQKRPGQPLWIKVATLREPVCLLCSNLDTY